jgi:hypothetical protein
LTDLRAIEQDADQVDLGMVAAGRDAMLQRDRAHRVAIQALLDALLHLIVGMLIRRLVLEIDSVTPFAVRH